MPGMADVLCSAELLALGNTDFVNTHAPGKTPPLLYAARQGHAANISSMILCGGNPERQGSDWIELLTAATSSFVPDMARAVCVVITLSGLLPVSLCGSDFAQYYTAAGDMLWLTTAWTL